MWQLTTVVCPLSGVLLRDQPLREKVLQELLIRENIAPRQRHPWYRGGSDREFLAYIWQSYRRSVSDDYLNPLVQKYQTEYERALGALAALPWYGATQAFLSQARADGCHLGLQTESNSPEFIQFLKSQSGIAWDFTISDYRHGFDPGTTLVIESTLLGIQQARAVGAKVLGVAHQLPYHWIQRHADGAVDTLADWDWERLVCTWNNN